MYLRAPPHEYMLTKSPIQTCNSEVTLNSPHGKCTIWLSRVRSQLSPTHASLPKASHMRGEVVALMRFVIVAAMIELVVAPRDIELAPMLDVMQQSPWTSFMHAAESLTSTEDAGIMAAAAAAGVAGAAILAVNVGIPGVPRLCRRERSERTGRHAKGILPIAGPPVDGDDNDMDSEAEEYDKDYESADDADVQPGQVGSSATRKASTGRLWSKDQFPEGTCGAANYDVSSQALEH